MLARSPATLRKRRQRQRERDGLITLSIEIHDHRVAEALIQSGQLSERQALDRAELKRAIERLMRALTWHPHDLAELVQRTRPSPTGSAILSVDGTIDWQ